MIEACLLCGRGDCRVLESAPDGVRVLECLRCRLIFLNPVPEVDPASHYDAEYYRPWRQEQAARRAALWGRRVHLLERYAPRGALLDVGCGDGSFLLAARERGWNVVGTEVSRWAIQALPAGHGLTVLGNDVTAIASSGARFDAVTVWHVLEHVPDPLDVLRGVRSVLNAHGILLVAVPNAACMLFRLAYRLCKLRRLRYYTPGERELHLYHFTSDTLRALLGLAGFDVVFEAIDESALTLPRRALQAWAKAVYALSGANWSEALLVVAAPGGSERP